MNEAVRERSTAFDAPMAFAGYWTVVGLYTDLGWHIRHHVDTFFTVQHAVLYSGLLALFGAAIIQWRRPGYRASFWGIGLFAAGGAADLLKHHLFGIEQGFDALVSPTHLAIGLGVAIAICAPVRAALSAHVPPASLAAQIPALISVSAFVELLHWITNPFFRINAATMFETPLPHQLTANALTLQTLHVYDQGGGLLAMILQALLLSAPALFLLRTLHPARGAFTLVFPLSNLLAALATSISWEEAAIVMGASLAAGLAADVLRSRPVLLCAIAPAAFNVVYLIGTAVFGGGIWWNASFAAGAALEASALSVFLNFVSGPLPVQNADGV